MRASAALALGAALAASMACLACGSAGEAKREPPPEGLPWLAESFDISVEAAGDACGGLATGFVAARSTGSLVQTDDRVVLTLETALDPEVRPLTLRGCVVGDAARGFQLRLEGANHATSTEGGAACTARVSLPAALGELADAAALEASRTGDVTTPLGTAEDAWLAAGCPAEAEAGAWVPAFEVSVCEDGHLDGTLDAQISLTGSGCHAPPPCSLGLRLTGAVALPAPAPEGALIGGPCP